MPSRNSKIAHSVIERTLLCPKVVRSHHYYFNTSITCDGVGITAKVMVKNDATFDATKGDLYAKLLESAEKHEVEFSFERRIVFQPPAFE